MHSISGGVISSELIMGLDMASEDRIEAVHTHHDHHHHHEEEHHHAHDHFSSVSIELGEVDTDKTLSIVQKLITENSVFRVKGFLALPGKPMRQVFQGVGERIERYFDRPWRADEKRVTRLVFIGKELDESVFSSALAEACSS